MPMYDYLYNGKEKDQKLTQISLTEDEEIKRRQDYEESKNAKEYRDSHRKDWEYGAFTYNVTQEGAINDSISNIYIGLGRMIIDQGISMVSEGEPSFDYAFRGPSDVKLALLWKASVEMVLSDCNYKSHQDKFMTDFHVFGPGVFECYTQTPMRTEQTEDADGNISSKIVRDLRRSKVGVRHVSPFHCWRNPNVTDPDEVPSSGKYEILTINQFIQNYANVYVTNANGVTVPKYKNIDQVLTMKGSHVKVEKIEDEVKDSVHIYALRFGDKPGGKPAHIPEHELGIPIFDKPLKIKRIKGSNGWKSIGSNALGMSSLCFGVNNDMYDGDFQTHSLYGMGIPRLIEGQDMAMQAFTNMNFDNMRLANTFAISYKPYDGKTQLDFDNMRAYSGMQVNGEIVTTPFGQVRLSENNWMNEWLNETSIYITGINFRQLIGDDLKTAFQAGLRVRQNNQRALRRIKTLENGCFKRMALLTLSNVLSELTVEEWENMTEEQVEQAVEKIKLGDSPAEDYKDLNGKNPQKRYMQYIPVKGKRFVENFSKTKKRKLNSNSMDNSLIEEKAGEHEVSYVPLDKKYLLPVDDIAEVIRFTVSVDGSHLLGDMKFQDMEMYEKMMNIAVQIYPLLPENEKPDIKSLFLEVVKHVGADEDKVFKNSESQSKILNTVKDILSQLENAQEPSAAPSQPAIPIQGSQNQPSQGAGNASPPQALQDLSRGII